MKASYLRNVIGIYFYYHYHRNDDYYFVYNISPIFHWCNFLHVVHKGHCVKASLLLYKISSVDLFSSICVGFAADFIVTEKPGQLHRYLKIC